MRLGCRPRKRGRAYERNRFPPHHWSGRALTISPVKIVPRVSRNVWIVHASEVYVYPLVSVCLAARSEVRLPRSGDRFDAHVLDLIFPTADSTFASNLSASLISPLTMIVVPTLRSSATGSGLGSNRSAAASD